MNEFLPANILLPKTDHMEKWAVIACDQFTSDQAYWDRVRKNAEGAVSNISIDASTQTTGIGSKVADDSFASGFVGWNGGEVSNGSPVDALSGATYSSNAVFNAVNAAIDCYNNEIKGVL